MMPNIVDLCKQYKVKRLYAFGSVLTDKFNDDSDVDLVVEFGEMPVEDYADNYFELKFSLQDMFNRPVDLLEKQAIKNPYFRQNINQKRQLVYGE
jgi:predicted nucleotidyltransferase